MLRNKSKFFSSFVTKCYRDMKNIKLLDQITNEALCKKTNRKPIAQMIELIQLKLIGHSLSPQR
jgi:hypothetical protein